MGRGQVEQKVGASLLKVARLWRATRAEGAAQGFLGELVGNTSQLEPGAGRARQPTGMGLLGGTEVVEAAGGVGGG